MEYFALWVTRNGQHLWDGPFLDYELAEGKLSTLMYCTGKRITERRRAR